jgi:predicted nuclease of restriction endonuclease-like (RecB) superfamily
MRVDNSKARDWYIAESVANNWSVRALDRQISTLYYERLLSSADREPVIDEAIAKTDELKPHIKDYLRDPYILDF